MQNEEMEETPGTSEGFHICDEGAANWVLRKLANIKSERARIEAQSAAMLKQLDTDEKSLMHRFGAELEEFARQTLAANGSRRRSLTLFQGTLAFRFVAPAMKVSDQEAAIRWAKENAPDLVSVTTTEAIDGKAFLRQAKAAQLADGELLPGVAVSEGGETFSIQFGKTESAE